MVTSARGVVDVAEWIRGQLDPKIRRAVEPDLIRTYHDALLAHGVQEYAIDQCLADYQLATVLAPARLACAVGLSDGLQPTAVRSGMRGSRGSSQTEPHWGEQMRVVSSTYGSQTYPQECRCPATHYRPTPSR